MHGVFEQKLCKHINGQGCSPCSVKVRALKRSGTTESFIQKANLKHNFKYDYSNVVYGNNCGEKVKIICKIHGEFEQCPRGHLTGKGCLLCKNLNTGLRCKSNTKEFIEKCSLKHNGLYDYSLVNYINNSTKVKIICPIHNIFEQTAAHHLAGKGCKQCAIENSGWSRTKFINFCNKNNNGLGVFYILKCFNETEEFFKIGITSNSIKQRYGSGLQIRMPYQYEIIQEIEGNSIDIYNLEKLLLKLYKDYKYNPQINFGGSILECFILP